MAKFTKLNIGDAVASSGGRVWKKLSAESAVVDDELVGTWTFNSPPTPVSAYDVKLLHSTAQDAETVVCILKSTSGSSYSISCGALKGTSYIGLYTYKASGGAYGLAGFQSNHQQTNNILKFSNLSAITFTSAINNDYITVTDTFRNWVKQYGTKTA